VREIQVKEAEARSRWIWGAFKMPGRVLADLRRLWEERERADEYIGTLANAYLARGGEAWGVAAGHSYVDVGTLNGYRAALRLLSEAAEGDGQGSGRVALGWPTGRALRDANGDRGRGKG
jgi:glucose-1-phosphate thymidylyltransferase